VRLFVAAYPPPAVRDDFALLVNGLVVGQPREPGRSVRLVPAEQWHVTLAFLGEVPEDAVDRAGRAVERAASSLPESPRLRIAGGGTFGRGRFTTLWAGLRGEVDRIGSLADALDRALHKARLPSDHKRFRPHVTVARPGDRITAAELAGDLAALDGYRSPVWTVGTIQLMRSHLGPRPSYDTLHEVRLGG
jgi:RNA 2',3'-cyclic 3'-phosphodiesterase